MLWLFAKNESPNPVERLTAKIPIAISDTPKMPLQESARTLFRTQQMNSCFWCPANRNPAGPHLRNLLQSGITLNVIEDVWNCLVLKMNGVSPVKHGFVDLAAVMLTFQVPCWHRVIRDSEGWSPHWDSTRTYKYVTVPFTEH